MLTTKRDVANLDSLPLRGCWCSHFLGEAACPMWAPASFQHRGRWRGCCGGSISVHPHWVPKGARGHEGSPAARRGVGSEPGEGDRWEGGRSGGLGPEFLAECCAHTPYLARPCLCSREPAAPVGREDGQHPQESPSSSPFHPCLPRGHL